MNAYGINKKDITMLYNMLDKFHTLAKEHDLVYWIDGGTLLGAVRHNSIIPWDDDIDISISNKKDNIKKLRKILLHLIYHLHLLLLQVFKNHHHLQERLLVCLIKVNHLINL